MDLEYLGALVGVVIAIGTVLGMVVKPVKEWLQRRAAFRERVEDNSKDTIELMDRMDKVEKRQSAMDEAVATMKTFTEVVTANVSHITEMMKVHTESNKQRFDDLQGDIRDLRDSINRRRVN